jgi:hypothetical protein
MLIVTRSAEAAGVWTAKILKLLSRFLPGAFSERVARQTAVLEKLEFSSLDFPIACIRHSG